MSPSAPEAGAQVIDLMEALRASLEKTAGKRAQPKAAAGCRIGRSQGARSASRPGRSPASPKRAARPPSARNAMLVTS